MVCGFPTAQGSLARWDNPSVMNRKAHFTRYKNLSNSSEIRASFDRRSPITTRFALIKCLITPIFAPLPAQSHESPNSSLDSGPCLVKIHIHKPENIPLNQFHLLEAGTNPAQAQGFHKETHGTNILRYTFAMAKVRKRRVWQRSRLCFFWEALAPGSRQLFAWKRA